MVSDPTIEFPFLFFLFSLLSLEDLLRFHKLKLLNPRCLLFLPAFLSSGDCGLATQNLLILEALISFLA